MGFILGVVLDDSGVFGAGFCVSFRAVLRRADGEEEVMVRWFSFRFAAVMDEES